MDLSSAMIATEHGFVSAEHQRIAEIVNDYDPDLFLAFIPEAKREPGDHPFAVIHRPVGRPEYIAFYADKCDERILERLFMNDLTKHSVIDQLEAKDRARKAVEFKRQMGEAEARKDLVQHIIKSPKTRYRHNGVTYE